MPHTNDLVSDEMRSKVEQDIKRLDMVSEKSQGIREVMISKLVDVMENITLDPNEEKPRIIEVKTKIFDTLNTVLNSYEKECRDTVRVKIKQQSDENVIDNVSTIITEIFNKLSSAQKKEGFPLDNENVDEEIEKLVNNKNILPSSEEVSSVSNSEKLAEEILNDFDEGENND